MEAFYFGSSQRPLFGVRHAPSGAARQTAVLICPSWGPEYMRAYRGLRMLATRLAGAGYETMRFDYSGTGDSEGMALDARLEHWLDDIATATAELRDLSGCQRVALLGLRSGALLAEAAQVRGLPVTAQILWDCPADGAAFVQLMRRLDVALDAQKAARRTRDAQLPPHAANELCGHAWPEPLAGAMQALPAPALRPAQLWLRSADHEVAPAAGSEQLALSESSRWQSEFWTGSPWLPAASIQALIEKLRAWLP